MQSIGEKILNEFYEECEKECRLFNQRLAIVKDIEGKKYFAYLMMDETKVLKENVNVKVDITEILFFELKEEIADIGERISPYSLIEKQESKYRIGKISNKIYSVKKIQDMSEIEKKIPKKGAVLKVQK